jgi:hypothetical protein
MPRTSNRATDDDLRNSKWPNEATVISVGAAAARNATVLEPGLYYLNSDAALHFKQGGSGVEATASSNFLPAGAPVWIVVSDEDDGYVSVIRHGSSSGDAFLNKPEVEV